MAMCAESITDLAVKLGAPISTNDFRTLNRCLDNAIAGAVTEFTCEQGITRNKQSAELNSLLEGAVFARVCCIEQRAPGDGPYDASWQLSGSKIS